MVIAVIAFGKSRSKAAVRVESPAMIKAFERHRRATWFARNHCAAMWARIKKGIHFASSITVKNHLAAANGSGQIITCLWQFRNMPKIEPAFAKYFFTLTFKNVFV